MGKKAELEIMLTLSLTILLLMSINGLFMVITIECCQQLILFGLVIPPQGLICTSDVVLLYVEEL